MPWPQAALHPSTHSCVYSKSLTSSLAQCISLSFLAHRYIPVILGCVFFFKFDFEITLNIQKSCKNSSKGPCVLFTSAPLHLPAWPHTPAHRALPSIHMVLLLSGGARACCSQGDARDKHFGSSQEGVRQTARAGPFSQGPGSLRSMHNSVRLQNRKWKQRLAPAPGAVRPTGLCIQGRCTAPHVPSKMLFRARQEHMAPHLWSAGARLLTREGDGLASS